MDTNRVAGNKAVEKSVAVFVYYAVEKGRNMSLIKASTNGREQTRSMRSARTYGKDGTRRSSTANVSPETSTPAVSKNARKSSHR